ncbi:MAG: cyclic nucleotide-binding domain-containing protein [Moraxellaceae bacterium]|nr:cyclic nucleotide-binding domain-containing protein [Moraxellaceae bacterium]
MEDFADKTAVLKPLGNEDDSDALLTVIIIGSGPAGLSAAARAAELMIPHVLLEAEDHASDTIYKYQKGKHVMAEPANLPLQSGMSFNAGKREDVLGTWNTELDQQGINIRYGRRVSGVEKVGKHLFIVTCENGEQYRSRHVVLGIGLQGNIRKLGVPGESLERVQYTLRDPAEFDGETVIVIGAGDAAIENALGLARQNRVILINRDTEFTRCKEANHSLIQAAAKEGSVEIRYGARTVRVEETGDAGQPLRYVANTPEGEESIPCHRVIARLGASPPRKLVEGFGIEFPSTDANAVPALSETYESNIPGLYVIGALGGYPLIKQAMNQGYEVVSTIMDLPVAPADEPLLLAKFSQFRPDYSVNEVLSVIQHNVPLFAGLTRLQMREFILESSILTPAAGSIIFAKNDYTNSFLSIVEGYAEVEVFDEEGNARWIRLERGQFFGEMGLISGRRRTATVRAGADCSLVETPRKLMRKLIASVESIRRTIDEVFVRRAITTYLAPKLPAEAISELMSGGVDVRRYSAGDIVFRQGDDPDYLYLIRSGSVTVSQEVGGRDVVLSYVSAGNYVGEMALLNDTPRTATVQATIQTEMLLLDAVTFKRVLAQNPEWRAVMGSRLLERVKSNVEREQLSGGSEIIRFLMGQGLGEGTDVLLIDESLCIQCNNCETACAETHNGMSRLNRAAGPTFNNIHVPTSCRHCEHPHCMKDCPPDAIRRSDEGEVFISDACIGCGNCERNCPYGVIQMRAPAPVETRTGLLSWIAFGLGDGPGEREAAYDPNQPKKAVKCDMCMDQKGGAACVRACPTGAAIRIAPERFMDLETD